MANALYNSLLSLNRMTYNQARNTGKLNLFAAFFLLFKSTVGLGLFSYPYVFSKVGIGYGIIFGVFICYITLYGIFTLAHLSNKLEDGLFVPKINSYDELVDYLADKAIGPRAGKWMANICIICCVIINGSVIVGAIIEISQILSSYFGMSQFYFKLLIIGAYFILSAAIIEPEKLKPYAFVSSGVVITIVTTMYISNIIGLLPHNINPAVSYTSFDISHMGIFFGVGGFSYEAAGTIFTIRSTMQQPKKMAPLILYTFAFIGFIFLMFSLSFYFVLGNENIQEVIFNVYDKDSKMFLLAIVFCCVLVIFVPLYNISNTELLEKIQWISNLVNDESGDKTRLTVVCFRVTTFAVFSGLALLTNEVTVVLNLAGGIAIPLVSFYLPYYLNFLYAKVAKKPRNIFLNLHDGLLIVLGFIIQYIILHYTITVQLIQGGDQEVDF